MAAEVAIKITADGKAVVMAAKQAEAALDGISTHADKTAASLKGATKSSEGLEAAMQKMGKPGQTGGLPSYVADLDKVGISAKQTANALRGVPAQFTDIVTSLQGGQAPLTVFLQQGGQLKDMFGGAGNAARALGGYVMGLVNPFTVGAAVVGGLAFAYEQGAKESRAFQNASTMSGNAIGQSASQFGAMTQSLSEIAGTRGKAAEALTEIASTGRLAGSEVKGIAEAAILMEKATGQAIGDTIKEFAKLADEPVKASLALNKQYNYLTAAVYEQIKALDEQGNKLGAAELAEKTYADALKARATTVIDNAGLMERAWRGITGAAKGAWDAMLGVGREASLQDKLAAVGKEIAKAQGPFNASAFGDGNAEAKAKLQANLQLQASLQEMVRLEQRGTEAAAQRNQVQLAGIAGIDAVAKANEKAASKQEQMNKALKDYRDGVAAMKAAGASGVPDAKKIADTEAAIREQYKATAKVASTAGQSEVARIQARIIETESYIKTLKSEGIAGKELNEGEKLAIKIQKELEGGLKGVALANKQKALTAAESLAAVLRESDALSASLKSQREFETQRDKEISGQESAILKLEEKALAMEDEVRMYGLGKQAIEALSIARLQERIDILAGFEGSTAQIALIEKEIDARKRLAVATDAKTGLDAGVKAAKEADAEWKRTATSVENTLTDSLMRSFEKGQTFARTARDTIVNMFKTLVLRPFISPIMSAGSSAVGSALGLPGAANASTGSGLLSNLSSANSLYSLASTGYAATLGAGVSSVLGATAGNAAIATAITGSASSATAAALAASQAAGTATAASATLASVGSSIATAVPYIAAALAAVAVVNSLLSKKDSRFGGTYADNFTGAGAQYIHGPVQGSTGDQAVRDAINATAAGINGLLKTVGSAASLIGYQAALETSNKGRGGVLAGGTLSTGATFGEDAVGSNYDGTYYETTSTNSPDSATANANFALDLKQSIVQALQATGDVPASIKKLVAGIDAEALSDADVTTLLNAINTTVLGVEQFRAALGNIGLSQFADIAFDAASAIAAASGGFGPLITNLSSYYDTYSTESEKAALVTRQITQALTAVNVAMPATRAEFKSQVEAALALGEAGAPAVAALLSVNQAFASVTPAIESVATVVDDVAVSISDTMKTLMTDRAGLDIELMRAQGNTAGADAAQFSLDSAGMTDLEIVAFKANTGIRALITTLTDAAAASTALAATNQGWTNQLDLLTGAETERSIALRDAGDDTTRALIEQVYAQQDLAAATATAAEAAKTAAASLAQVQAGFMAAAQAGAQQMADAKQAQKADLQEQLDALTLSGAALADKQFVALSRVNAVLFRQVQAATAVSDAQKDLIAVSQDAASSFGALGDSLRDFRAGVLANAASANGAQAATSLAAGNFRSVSTRASLGDKDAMGQLAGAGQGFLTAAAASASTALDYQRALLTVLSGTDSAISVADQQVSLAEQQLGALVGIKEVLTMAQAQANLSSAQGSLDRVNANAPFDLAMAKASDAYRSSLNTLALQGFGTWQQAYEDPEYAKTLAIETAAKEAAIKAKYEAAVVSINAARSQAASVPVPASYRTPAAAQSSSPDVVAAINRMHAGQTVANREIALNTLRFARLADKWDIDGQPAVRQPVVKAA
jgi:phage-related minor tail protein